MDQAPSPTGPKKPQQTNSFLKYSGFAIQLFGGLALAGWAGHKLDEYLHIKFPAFLLTFVLVVLIVMLYQMYLKLKQD